MRSRLTAVVTPLFMAAALISVPHDARVLLTSGHASGAHAAHTAGTGADGTDIIGASVGIPQTSATWGGGDTWYNTWGADGNIYATSDDSEALNGKCHSNFDVNELTGDDPSELSSPFANCMTGYGVPGSQQNYNDGRTWKTDGVISVDGTLYVAVARQVDGCCGYPDGYQSSNNTSIIKSTDNGRTWSNSFGTTDDPNGAPPPPNPNGQGPEAMFPGTSFGTPEFVNYGQDDNPASTADGGDQYVYAISNDGWSYDGSYMILGRVPRSEIGALNAADWQFYTGQPDGNGMDPGSWSSDASKATHIISATHELSQSGVQYIPSLRRYVLTSYYYPFNSEWPHDGYSSYVTWSFYEAPHPWGPWTRFYSQPTLACYFSCDSGGASPIGLYDPVLASKFVNVDGLSDVVFASGDWESRTRPNDSLYTLHAFPFTLTTTGSRLVDDMTGTTYTGTWSGGYAQGGYYDDSLHDSNSADSVASYTFEGDSVAWVGSRNNNHGYASVSIDGGPPVSVDTYASQWEKQQVLYQSPQLSPGRHTITIMVTSQKDSASSGTYQDVDAYVVGR